MKKMYDQVEDRTEIGKQIDYTKLNEVIYTYRPDNPLNTKYKKGFEHKN